MAVIFGDDGDNLLAGTTGDDSISGLGGNDTINGGFGNDTVLGGAGADSLSASDGTDLIDGGSGADYLSTNYFGNPTEGVWEDTLLGGKGADYLWLAGSANQGAPGRVLLDGGDGYDFVELHMGYTDDRTVDLRGLNGGGTFIMPGVELVRIEGGLFDLGYSSNDLVYLPDFGVTVDVNLGSDTVIGGAGDDTIRAGVAPAGEGGDSLDGGDGHDLFTLDYGIGDSPAGVIDLDGFGGGHLVLADGTVLDNFEEGEITFGLTDDVITYGAAINLTVNAGQGDDEVKGGRDGDLIRGGEGKDRLDGGRGGDELYGGDNPDKLFGGRGGDLLDGGAHRDSLVGGLGTDTLTGGGGGDRFIFRKAEHLDGDLITDLQNKDLINLKYIDADQTTGGDQAFTLVADFTGNAGELRLRLVDGNTLLEFDTDGNSEPNATLTISGDHTDFTNFVL